MRVNNYKHKPIYKKLHNLRKNIQYRVKLEKLKIKSRSNLQFLDKFKKKKWVKFKSIRNFQYLYNHNIYLLPKYNKYYTKNYKLNLLCNKRFFSFYGNLTIRYFKLQKKNNSKVSCKNFKFIGLLEKRLDTVLYRACFSLSFRESRWIIAHKHVFINNILINHSSYLLKSGDFIKLSKRLHPLIIKNIRYKNNYITIIPSKNLYINYKTLEIVYIGRISYPDLLNNYPFWLDLNLVVNQSCI